MAEFSTGLPKLRSIQAFLTSLREDNVSLQIGLVGTIVGEGDREALILHRPGASPDDPIPNISVDPNSVFQLRFGGQVYPIRTARGFGARSLTLATLSEVFVSNRIPPQVIAWNKDGNGLRITNDKQESLSFKIFAAGDISGRYSLKRFP